MSEEEEITSINDAVCRAYASGDTAAIRARYTDNPWLMAPNAETIKGKDAIQEAFQGFLDAGITGLALATNEVEAFGDTAVEMGEYGLSVGDAVADQGKYIVVWKKQGGQWLIHRDIFNSNLPAPE